MASVGTAGVPGVGIIMLGMVLNQVGLPLEGIAIVIGVDRLLDMLRTSLNVSGDAMTMFNSLLALEVITSALFSFSKSFFITSISFFKDRAVAFCISIDNIDSSISLKIHR